MKTASQKKIFIVDDDPMWTEKMTQLLENLGYNNIFHFESGEDCISNLSQNPAIIFLDFKMKAMDGLQVLGVVKEYMPSIAIIFCTANKDLGLAVRAMKSGSVDFMVKQHTTEETLGKVLEDLQVEDTEKIY